MEPMKLGYLALSKALFGVVRNRSGEDLNMRPSQIAAQLYSFRDFRHSGTPAGVPDTLKRLRAIGYESVQLSSALPAMPESELARILSGEGFTAPTAHEPAARHDRAAARARLPPRRLPLPGPDADRGGRVRRHGGRARPDRRNLQRSRRGFNMNHKRVCRLQKPVF